MTQLGADQVINRTYVREGFAANVFIAWYQWQQEGSRQTHSPLVCLPASGWVTDRTDEVRLSTSAGDLSVNRLAIRAEGQRGAMLYWYQNRRGTVTGEWAEKFQLIEGAVRDRRTDGAFVRVFIPLTDQSQTGSAESIAQALYPSLREYLPW